MPNGLVIGIHERLMGFGDGSPGEELAQIIDAACEFERNRYEFLWFAEHHTAATLCGAPEIAVSIALRATTTLRIGTAGLILPLHSPVRICEQFRALNAWFPGRVDLGVCRGPGVDSAAQFRHHSGGEDLRELDAVFRRRLSEFTICCRDSTGEGDAATYPLRVGVPPVLLMGTSRETARIAAEVGFGMVLSVAHQPSLDLQERAMVVDAYRTLWRETGHVSEPRLVIAATIVCEDTPDDARIRTAAIESQRQMAIAVAGDPFECWETLQHIAATFKTNEILLVSVEPQLRDRMAVYRRLRRAWSAN